MAFFYVLTYILGFFYRRCETKFKPSVFIVEFIVVISILFRLIGKFIIDGTELYDCIISSMTHIILCFGIFYFIKKFFTLNINNKIINYFDNLSFYVYITHYIFMSGPLRSMAITNNILCNISLTLVLSFLSAIALQFIDSKIQNI